MDSDNNRLLTEKLLLLTVVVSFVMIYDDDTKWDLPILIWSIMMIVAGKITDKIIFSLFVSSWLYLFFSTLFLWVSIVSLTGKRLLLICIAILLLIADVLYFGNIVVSADGVTALFDSGNSWFSTPALIFIGSSLTWFYRVFSSR